MKRPSDPPFAGLRTKLIGLGERSFRKSYYPELQARIEQLERFRSLLDQTSDLILVVDLDSGGVVDANLSACRQLRLDSDDLCGRSLGEILDLEALDWLAEGTLGEQGTLYAPLRGVPGVVLQAEVSLSMDDFGGTTYLVVVARDVSDRLRVEVALRESEERFRSIVDSSPLGVHLYRLEPSGRLVFAGANPAADAILGLDHSGLVGRTLEEAFPSLAGTEVPERYRRACSEGESWHAERILYRDEAIEGAYEVHAFPTGPLRMAAFFLDITDRKRAEELLRQSDRLKSEFITTAAHELRTPLTSILGFSQLLTEVGDRDPELLRESLGYIRQRAEALARIVDDLLDIARLEAGQPLPLHTSDWAVRELAERAEPLLRSAGTGRRWSWALEDQERLVRADREKIGQVLENLLSNAVKYSAPGSEIRISGRPRERDYLVSVRDRGVGMSAEEVARIFDKFFRADTTDTALGGIGLGMSIVRAIVEQHGGTIRVESEPGRGTRVSFTLPLAPREEAAE